MSTITLTNGATTLQLPSSLDWTDELSWSPVEQTQTYTTTGALLIEEGIKQAGRPYTLEGSDDRAWATRELVLALRGWAATPGLVMQLLIRGVVRNVTFDHARGALAGLPVMFYEDGSMGLDDYYVPTIRLIGL
jgi:hypothetical protein